MQLCVCVLVRVHLCFQSGGGGGGGREGWAVVAVVVCGKEIHQPWEMEIVSKTVGFFILSMVIVKNHSDHFLFDSNYDKQFYWRRFWVPTDSSPDPEDHTYGPEDPHALHQ